MDKLFISKLNNREYISKQLYNSVKDMNDVIPLGFNLDKYSYNC